MQSAELSAATTKAVMASLGLSMPVSIPSSTSIAVVAIAYVSTYIFSAALPGIITPGYVLGSNGKPSLYKLNGLLVLLVTVALAVLANSLGVISLTYTYLHYTECAAAAFAIGIVFSIGMFLRGRPMLAAGTIDKRSRCETADPKAMAKGVVVDSSEFDRRQTLEHFWCGLSEFNPKLVLDVDVKMWLYVVGAVQLQLNLLSCAAAHISWRAETAGLPPAVSLDVVGVRGSMGYGMAAYISCLSFFLVEYMSQERVHLYTYDIFRERVGFKLAWGCLTFYPFFYAIGGLPMVQSKEDVTREQATACMALYFAGWVLTRGANLQKFYFKLGSEKFLGGLIPMVAVPGSNGRLLCSGFWALSRHINYLGEIVQAVALALPGWLATGSVLPWLYPLYYVALFVPRQMDDDAMCAARYGKAWEEYVRRVPYRIVPYVY